jgi:hypothetical protein
MNAALVGTRDFRAKQESCSRDCTASSSIFDSTDPIANLFATDGRYQKRSAKREELRRALEY